MTMLTFSTEEAAEAALKQMDTNRNREYKRLKDKLERINKKIDNLVKNHDRTVTKLLKSYEKTDRQIKSLEYIFGPIDFNKKIDLNKNIK